ncbi:MAG: 16S rRNA (cytidine(1402)-2'-O)-methyltransferase [Gammaproteobacteria bacterium]|nr:16S rRNA (cytidine(1402)-2'-O)-methyltransferase [Gammaproteobacteria bacterium]NNJ96432.1 16S rRNA (cytidine(1402)-2'-O)-methyltransferase [Gammaproteobacteria bacterium]
MSNQTLSSAALFLVATPIGNLGDISSRALQTLQSVDLIAAEDTRHSKRLLQHFAIDTRLIAYHEHNEDQQTPQLIARLQRGRSVALISDAGTPLVSDPGYRLVQAALQQQIRVVPVPGPCAAIAALSVSGLPSDRFVFEGFPPAKQGTRVNYLQTLQSEQRTLIFYVSCHRITDTMIDMRDVLGGQRQAVLARELTKTYETIRKATLDELVAWVIDDSDQQKGEMVLLIEGVRERGNGAQLLLESLLPVLVDELPVKQAATIASKVTGLNKNELYKRALALKENTK